MSNPAVDAYIELDERFKDYQIAAEARADAHSAEIARLQRWKAEATAVLVRWDKVADALLGTKHLGALKSDAALAEVERLKAELAQFRAVVIAATPGTNYPEVLVVAADKADDPLEHGEWIECPITLYARENHA